MKIVVVGHGATCLSLFDAEDDDDVDDEYIWNVYITSFDVLDDDDEYI